jgi:integration host factor subunit beta
MTGSELVTALRSQHPWLTPQAAEHIVSQVFQSMVEALAQGDRIELRGFGVFGVKALSARQRRNPRTGALVWLAAQRRPFFKAAKEMHARLNESKGTTRESQEQCSATPPVDD